MPNLTKQTRRVLSEKISEHFSGSDLQQLCFFMNVDYDNLSGSRKDDKLIGLITACEQEQMVEDLIEQCRRMRPNVEYPDIEYEYLSIKRKAKVSQSQSRIFILVVIGLAIISGLFVLFTKSGLEQIISLFSLTNTPTPTYVPCNVEIKIDDDNPQILAGQTISLGARMSGSNLQSTWLTDYGTITNSSGDTVSYTAPLETGKAQITLEVDNSHCGARDSIELIIVAPSPTPTNTLTPTATATSTPEAIAAPISIPTKQPCGEVDPIIEDDGVKLHWNWEHFGVSSSSTPESRGQQGYYYKLSVLREIDDQPLFPEVKVESDGMLTNAYKIGNSVFIGFDVDTTYIYLFKFYYEPEEENGPFCTFEGHFTH
ncbi:MAG: hypothetical protein GY803_17240 [Chloroflexi bacterium]|nr:hypothetical protein [Chloroflexota bacterium]